MSIIGAAVADKQAFRRRAIMAFAVTALLIILGLLLREALVKQKPGRVTDPQLLKQARQAYKNQEFKKAIPKLERYVRRHGDDQLALSLLASSYWQLQDYKKALAYTETLVKMRPDDADAYYRMGMLARELSLKKRAIGYLERATAIRPQTIQFRALLAKALADDGQVDRAIEEWNNVLKLPVDASYRAMVDGKIENLEGMAQR